MKRLLLIFLLIACPAQAAIKDNLISYWSMDEASGDAVDAHSTNTLTETSGTITSAAGKVGTSREFVAADTEYFIHADNAALSVGDIDFTIAMWVYPTATASVGIFTKGDSTGIEYSITARSNGKFRLEVDNGAGLLNLTPVDSTPTYTTNNWYFVVAWHDSVNNEIGIQVNNGTPDTNTDILGSWDSTIPLYVGVDGDFGDSFSGRLDEIGFWKGRLLTTDEKTFLFNGGAGRSYAGLTARPQIAPVIFQ